MGINKPVYATRLEGNIRTDGRQNDGTQTKADGTTDSKADGTTDLMGTNDEPKRHKR